MDSSCRTNEQHCARVRYNAYRSKQIFDIWKDVWGSQRSRLKFVLSTQSAPCQPSSGLCGDVFMAFRTLYTLYLMFFFGG